MRSTLDFSSAAVLSVVSFLLVFGSVALFGVFVAVTGVSDSTAPHNYSKSLGCICCCIECVQLYSAPELLQVIHTIPFQPQSSVLMLDPSLVKVSFCYDDGNLQCLPLFVFLNLGLLGGGSIPRTGLDES